MFGLFKRKSTSELKSEISRLHGEALNYQRSGNRQLYFNKMREIDQLERKIKAYQAK